jgi:hypothetical protein
MKIKKIEFFRPAIYTTSPDKTKEKQPPFSFKKDSKYLQLIVILMIFMRLIVK